MNEGKWVERKANKIESEGEGQERGGRRVYRWAGRKGGREGEDGRSQRGRSQRGKEVERNAMKIEVDGGGQERGGRRINSQSLSVHFYI